VTGVAGICKQRAVGRITVGGAAHLGEDVLLTVVVDIGESYPMAFLKVPEIPRSRHFLEEPSARIPPHAIWNQRSEIGIARSHIEIELAVVIEVAEVDAHPQHRPVDVRGVRYIRKSALTVIAIQV